MQIVPRVVSKEVPHLNHLTPFMMRGKDTVQPVNHFVVLKCAMRPQRNQYCRMWTVPGEHYSFVVQREQNNTSRVGLINLNNDLHFNFTLLTRGALLKPISFFD